MNDMENLLVSLLEQVQEVEDAIFDVYSMRSLANAKGWLLDLLGKLTGELRGGALDDDYRIRIAARVATNKSKGMTEDLISVAKLALGSFSYTSLAKPGASSSGANVGAFGLTPIVGDFRLRATLPANNGAKYIGLTEIGPRTLTASSRNGYLQYAFQTLGFTALDIYEDGGTVHIAVGAFDDGSVVEIARVGSVISYYLNDALVYVSARPSSATLYVDSAFSTTLGALKRVYLTQGGVDVPITYDVSSNLVKTAATSAYDAAALSNETLVGDGRLELIGPGTADPNRWIGLTLTNPGFTQTNITFSIRFNAGGTYECWFGGAATLSATAYTAGDHFHIRRAGNVLTVYQNNVLKHTYPGNTAAPLLVSAMIYTSAGTLTGVRLANANNFGTNLTWNVLTNTAADEDIILVHEGGPASQVIITREGIATVKVRINNTAVNATNAATLLKFLSSAKRAGVKLYLETSEADGSDTYAYRMSSVMVGAHSSAALVINPNADADANAFPSSGYLLIDPDGTPKMVAYQLNATRSAFNLTNGPLGTSYGAGTLFVLCDAKGKELSNPGLGDENYPAVGGKYASSFESA